MLFQSYNLCGKKKEIYTHHHLKKKMNNLYIKILAHNTHTTKIQSWPPGMNLQYAYKYDIKTLWCFSERNFILSPKLFKGAMMIV